MTKDYYAVVPSGWRIKLDIKDDSYKVGDIVTLEDGLEHDILWRVIDIRRVSDSFDIEFVINLANIRYMKISKQTYIHNLDDGGLKQLMAKYSNYLTSSKDWVLTGNKSGSYYRYTRFTNEVEYEVESSYGYIYLEYLTVDYYNKVYLQPNLKEIALKVSICTGLSAEHIDANY